MIDLWMVALLHTFGAIGVFGWLAVETYRRQHNGVAAAMRLLFCAWFLRYTGSLWYAAGYGHPWLEWTTRYETMFVSGAVLYVGFVLADRHRWWNTQ